MRLFGAECPKRTVVLSNTPLVDELCTGKLVRALHPSKIRTTSKYVDGCGRTRFKGTASLKSTQQLGQACPKDPRLDSGCKFEGVPGWLCSKGAGASKALPTFTISLGATCILARIRKENSNSKVNLGDCVPAQFMAAPPTSWRPAELLSTIQYLRGCAQLALPAQFREIFPKHLEEGEDRVRHGFID